MLKNKLLANHLYDLGINITCITNYTTEYNFYDANILKGPYHAFEHLKKNRQTKEELNNYDWENSVGLGTLAGFENLRVLDIDGCSNHKFIDDILIILGLPKNYEWVVRTGSLDGFHIYFYSDINENLIKDQVASSYPPNLDNTSLFEKMELLWKTHVVLPNSLHRSGFKYNFVNCKFPKSKPKFIQIDRFKVIETLFLNISEIEKKKVYYSLSKAVHRNVSLPKNLKAIDLSSIDKKLFFLFDIETDGLIDNNNYPNIVQISWIIMDIEGVVYKKTTELINCNFNEKSEAFKVNKIDPKIIRKIGREPSEVYYELIYDLKYCDIISAHNLNFDLSILIKELDKYNIEFYLDNIVKFCTMEYGTKLIKTEENPKPKYPKLTEIFEYLFNHKTKQFHNSHSDVTILAKCIKEMIYTNKLMKFS